MSDLKLKLGLGADKGQIEKTGQEIQAMLNRAMNKVGGFKSISDGVKNAFSDGFSQAQSAATKTSSFIRQQMYNALSSRWADPTFANVSSQFVSGMKNGVEQLASLIGNKVRGAFGVVDAKPLAENVGDAVEQTLRQKITSALNVNGAQLGGFIEGKFSGTSSQPYKDKFGDILLNQGVEDANAFASAVMTISAELQGAVEQAEALAESGESGSEEYQEWQEAAEQCVQTLLQLYDIAEQPVEPVKPTVDSGTLNPNVPLNGDAGGVLAQHQHTVKTLGDLMDTLKGKIAGIGPAIGGAFGRLYESSPLLQALGRDASRIGANFSVMAGGVGKVAHGLGQVANTSLNGLKKGVGAVTTKLAQMGKQASRSADTVQKKMKRTTLAMIKAMIGVRGLYMLFRKLRQAIKESMDTLAQNVPEFNQVFSEFKTALNGIKGSIGTAFQPILQAVLPILTQLANALANVMTMIGKFNAVLMGQNYIYKFTAAQQDYAKSLKGTGSAAKKATKDLMGFDEINRLSDKDSGGGGGSSGIGDYEKEMIDRADAISEFAEMVKKAWEESDFTQVGKKIGESIKTGMQSATKFFDTEGQQWAQKLSASLSTLINGLVSVEGLGYSIGESLGAGLNVGITFLRDFWRDTDWTGVGEQLGGAINGLFDKVDWVGLGEYFGFKFNGIFNFIGGLADSTEWDNIGTSLATSLNTMIETMDVGEATANVSKLIVGLLESGIAFLSTTDFESIGGKIADGLAGIDWKNLLGKTGTLLSKGAQGILDMVIGFVKKTDWNKTTQDILNGIGDMFKNIWDDGNLINKLAEGFGALLGAAITALFNIGNFIYDNVIVPLGKAFEESFPEPSPGDEWYDIGWKIIQGIFKGILDALIGIGKWINDNIVQPMIDGVCDAFGIHSPATTMIEIGAELVAGLLQGLQNLWETIKEPFETALEGIQGLFSGIGTWFSDRWEDIKVAFTAVGTWFSETFQTAWDNITGIFEGIGGWFSDRWDDITGVFKDVGSWFSEKFSEAWENIKSAFSTVGSFFQGIFDDIKGIFSTIGDEIGSAVSTAFQSAVNWILEKAVNLINGFIDGLNMAIDIINLIPKVNIDKIDRLDVPQLAEGAVLPPNQPFLAMVGDQTSGTNVEAPLDTIKQAVAEVIMENNDILTMGFEAVVQAIQNKDMSVRIGDKDIGQATARYNSQMNIMRGTT